MPIWHFLHEEMHLFLAPWVVWKWFKSFSCVCMSQKLHIYYPEPSNFLVKLSLAVTSSRWGWIIRNVNYSKTNAKSLLDMTPVIGTAQPQLVDIWLVKIYPTFLGQWWHFIHPLNISNFLVWLNWEFLQVWNGWD